jgi:hypothetical protein
MESLASAPVIGHLRASADGCLDRMHLHVAETRRNGECTIRRGRLGRRRGGEMSSQRAPMDAIERRHGMSLVGSVLLHFAGLRIPVWQCLPR